MILMIIYDNICKIFFFDKYKSNLFPEKAYKRLQAIRRRDAFLLLQSYD